MDGILNQKSENLNCSPSILKNFICKGSNMTCLIPSQEAERIKRDNHYNMLHKYKLVIIVVTTTTKVLCMLGTILQTSYILTHSVLATIQ